MYFSSLRPGGLFRLNPEQYTDAQGFPQKPDPVDQWHIKNIGAVLLGTLLPHRALSAALQPASRSAEKGGRKNMDLVIKPRAKSFVWLYFGYKAGENGRPLNPDEVVCRLCRKIVCAKGNTTNLRSHLRRRHPSEFNESIGSATAGPSLEPQGNNNATFSASFSYWKHPPALFLMTSRAWNIRYNHALYFDVLLNGPKASFC